ncbi:MAG TPA: hypothetical protein PL167_05845, partial [Cyclobacteriaceae bacterium]|nr:hypothetical protein [Cyclobacteriaceae bacterium]
MKNLTSPTNKLTTALISLFVLSVVTFNSFSQSKPAVTVFTKKQKGVGFVTSDSVFSLNFQFRMQNRAMYISNS